MSVTERRWPRRTCPDERLRGDAAVGASDRCRGLCRCRTWRTSACRSTAAAAAPRDRPDSPESGAHLPRDSCSNLCRHSRGVSPSGATAVTSCSFTSTTTTTSVTRTVHKPDVVPATGLWPRRPHPRLSSPRSHCHTARHSIYWSLCHSPINHLLPVLLLLVAGLLPLPVSVMARPTPKWSNPCGVDLNSYKAEGSAVTELDTEAYANIVMAAAAAEEHTANTKKQFVEETFGDPDFMKEFEWLSYDWLPKIDDPITEDQLNNLKIVPSLHNSFKYLQYFAVAIDQLILDQLVYEGNFLAKFRRMETDLATVLCQMQTAMVKLQELPDAGVTKEVMSEEERTVESETTRNVRDFIIMRDYQKTLLYIDKVFKHFRDKSSKSPPPST